MDVVLFSDIYHTVLDAANKLVDLLSSLHTEP